MTALLYILFDLLLFHMLSAWIMMLIELIELAPILIGAWFYWVARGRIGNRTGYVPRILYLPILSIAIQLQILLFAGLYHHLGLA